MTTRPPTAKDWEEPKTEADWKRVSKRAAKRMGVHDKLPRDVRLMLYEVGELPDWQMKHILANFERNMVSVVMSGDGTKYVIRPEPKRVKPRNESRD